LALDAIAHGGPASLDRIDREYVGGLVAAELDLTDLLDRTWWLLLLLLLLRTC
jgi:hypothetical protein